MNTKQVVGYSLVLLTLILVIIAMATEGWLVADREYSTGSNHLTVGVKTYTQTWTSSSGVSSKVTGQLKDVSTPTDWANLASKLDDGGTKVIATGVIALCCLVAGFIIVLLYKRQYQSKMLAFTGHLLLLLAVFFISLGYVLYAKKVDVGWCYFVFLLVAFLLLVTVTLLIVGSLQSSEGSLKQWIAIGLVAVALILCIVAMASMSWIVIESSSASGTLKLELGVDRYVRTWTSSSGQQTVEKGKISDLSGTLLSNTEFYNKVRTAGRAILGTGIVALFFMLTGAIIVSMNLMKKLAKFYTLGVFCVVVAIVMVVVGIAVFSKQLDVGYGFMLFIASSFICLAGFALLSLGTMAEGGSVPTDPQVRNKHDPSSTPIVGGTSDQV
eukprot:TRINITY_DN474_c0_g2_i1.p1 TRINITY_DN474_c0_g2~~TRINITY_DN474_c0_g2_i1.p1  ORF type:complete len:384 (-),score=116.89 TRINITY_DN474_c0_g2_i1:413-1564(-)